MQLREEVSVAFCTNRGVLNVYSLPRLVLNKRATSYRFYLPNTQKIRAVFTHYQQTHERATQVETFQLTGSTGSGFLGN